MNDNNNQSFIPRSKFLIIGTVFSLIFGSCLIIALIFLNYKYPHLLLKILTPEDLPYVYNGLLGLYAALILLNIIMLIILIAFRKKHLNKIIFLIYPITILLTLPLSLLTMIFFILGMKENIELNNLSKNIETGKEPIIMGDIRDSKQIIDNNSNSRFQNLVNDEHEIPSTNLDKNEQIKDVDSNVAGKIETTPISVMSSVVENVDPNNFSSVNKELNEKKIISLENETNLIKANVVENNFNNLETIANTQLIQSNPVLTHEMKTEIRNIVSSAIKKTLKKINLKPKTKKSITTKKSSKLKISKRKINSSTVSVKARNAKLKRQ